MWFKNGERVLIELVLTGLYLYTVLLCFSYSQENDSLGRFYPYS
ncbi:hypothetical protein PPIS_a3372 [Pseudoalteromonas piscicida]|uniref:Uncharacterized protein n=1 Tax=Pseudoalteromonas piscicida TaxID=43662 RepID=A0ABM6NGM5_PSEO7|nr:hypothetical protein PPIS_a3372 [Pseudoalteromonas piscicida]